MIVVMVILIMLSVISVIRMKKLEKNLAQLELDVEMLVQNDNSKISKSIDK